MAEKEASNDHDTTDNPIKGILKRKKKEEEKDENPIRSILKKSRASSGDDKDTSAPQPRSILKKKSDNATPESRSTEDESNSKISPIKVKVEKDSLSETTPKSEGGRPRKSRTKGEKSSPLPTAPIKLDVEDDDDDYGEHLTSQILKLQDSG